MKRLVVVAVLVFLMTGGVAEARRPFTMHRGVIAITRFAYRNALWISVTPCWRRTRWVVCWVRQRGEFACPIGDCVEGVYPLKARIAGRRILVTSTTTYPEEPYLEL